MMQFSLKWPFALTALAALSCFGVINTSEILAAVFFWLALLAVLLSVVGAIIFQAATRAFCVGFAVFGWSQLFLAIGGEDGRVNAQDLRPPLEPVGAMLWGYVANDYTQEEAKEAGWIDQVSARDGFKKIVLAGRPPPPLRFPTQQDFNLLFNAISAIWLALVGGVLASFLYRLEKRKPAIQDPH